VRRLVLLVFVLLFAAAGCGSGDDSASGGDTTTTAVNECVDVEAPDSRDPGSHKAPTAELDASKTYTLTFDTSCGAFTVTLDQKASPNATASLVSLAQRGFFDDTFFHRIVPGFVIQGGDPTGTGSGGPAYQTHDNVAADATYVHGVVAMAKAGSEPAGTAGSQFFVVTGDDIGLPPDYAIVGKVTKGLDVVQLIGTQGDPATEQPLRPVVVRSVTAASTP